MKDRQDFKFSYLQPTGVGIKTLSIPPVPNTFSWTAQQVAKLGEYKQAIYILAQEDLMVTLDLDVS